MRLVLAVVLFISACTHRASRVPFAGDLDAFLASHPLAAGQAIRVDEIGRTASASYHVVQVRGGESPHRHVVHDLTVLVLRGRGRMTQGDDARSLERGDAIVVPRGEPHWFVNRARGASVALVVFAPPLDAPDSVPVEVR